MSVMRDSQLCSFGGFDLLFIAVKLKDRKVNVYFRKTNIHG